MKFKIIKCKDTGFIRSEIQAFYWNDFASNNEERLYVLLKGQERSIYVAGPKTLLDQFEKQMEEE